MSRSFIGIADESGVNGIYCRWEPFEGSTAQILLEHYQSSEKIKELLVLGEILFLQTLIKDIEKPVGIDSDSQLFPSISSAIKNSWLDFHAEYCYIYVNGSWIGFTSKPGVITGKQSCNEDFPPAPNSNQSDYQDVLDYAKNKR